jgi:hypothetical protein
MIKLANLSITASDVTGQRNVSVSNIRADQMIGELVDGLLPRMNLRRLDREGHPIRFDARLDREARHLHRSELAGDALQPNDHLVLHPRIMAGGPVDR